jgi:hypothetical protein
MCNHSIAAKAIVKAASTLTIVLLTIGMGVNSTWAGSETPTLSELIFQPANAACHPRRFITLQRASESMPIRIELPTLNKCQRIAAANECTCPQGCTLSACHFDDNNVCQCK